MPPRTIDSRGLLYHFLQRDLLEDDVWLFQSLAARLIVRLGIWLSPDVYSTLPILVPYARRDPSARGNRNRGLPDSWGAPDRAGYFRDDNSLIKGIPRSMPVTSGLAAYSGKRVASGFVAAHVWRGIKHEELASRHPSTYSFVPNLVWLPSDVAKLTDREGSFSQQFIQALSWKIYRGHPVSAGHTAVVDQTWALIPEPVGIPAQGLPDLADLNFFRPGADFYARRVATIRTVADALSSGSATGKVISRRYGDGLRHVPGQARKTLAGFLAGYAAVVAGVESDEAD